MSIRMDYPGENGPFCYCGSFDKELCMLSCEQCKRMFHLRCLKSGKPSTFSGDMFFTLLCADCSETGAEICSRMKLQWLPVVMLALYNLQMLKNGNRGYFRWKEQICHYIDQNWTQFFGHTRKKTTTWHGTVAGVLSSGCPQYFQSGTQELKESGWWRLVECKPPPLDVLSSGKSGSRKQRLDMVREQTSPLKIEGLRSRAGKTSIQAAMELRAKRDSLTNARESKRAKLSAPSTPKSATTSPVRSYSNCSDRLSLESASTSFKDDSASRDDLQLSSSVECTPMRSNSSFDLASDFADQSSQMSFSSTKSEHWFTVKDLVPAETVPDCLLKDDDEEESDLEIDPCALSPSMSALHSPKSEAKERDDPLPQMEDILALLESKAVAKVQDVQNTNIIISQPPVETEPNTFYEIKQELTTDDSNMGSDLVTVKQEPVSEDSNTFDSSVNFTPKHSTGGCFLLPAPVSHPQQLVTSTPQPSFVSEDLRPVVAKVEPPEEEEEEEVGESSSSEEEESEDVKIPGNSAESTELKVRRRKREEDKETEEDIALREAKRCVPLSLYEEKQLVKVLNNANGNSNLPSDLKRLRRKLIVRQQKREHGQKLFDLDSFMNKTKGLHNDSGYMEKEHTGDRFSTTMLGHPLQSSGLRILDRFQSNHHAYYKRHTGSFLNRLVGSEDDQLQTIKSPYTARLLKPFIRRDYKSQPLKLKLLQEIKAYPHRNDADWVLPPSPPIDYCYVRPQHISSVNLLCREFFWPGIDMSECLQYPDFSCVVLYRKFVIGFAFMVPDVKYNEAYISFIFTHPEWRGAGIGTFMVYHLIQTCMGKDVTLHVSASNPAMMLYQKFGFKTEEFILDFYEKYFPEEARDSRHAFFLRLHR